MLNRYSKSSPLNVTDIETALRRKTAVKIPNDFNEIIRAINAGIPVTPSRSAGLLSAFDVWSDRLVGEGPAAEDKTKESRGWFRLTKS